MWIFDWIKNIFKSDWMKAILAFVLDRIKEILSQVGKDALNHIKKKIIEVGSNTNYDNKKKFEIVFEYVKSMIPALRDSAINLLIETLVNQLKAEKKLV